MTIREAKEIFQRLRNGAVPDRGLEAFAVGIERQRKELTRKLEEARSGTGDVKFLRGGYGCGKTFMANLMANDAQQMGFVTSFVVVSDNDFHLHKFEDLYSKVVSALSTPACKQGALGDILDRWIGAVEESLFKLGVAEDDVFDKKVLAKIDETLQRVTGVSVPADMTRVLRTIFELKQAGKLQEASGLISWLSGSPNVTASFKSLAGVKGEIDSTNALSYLRGILEIVKSAGYQGLIIVVDEVETILRVRGDVRSKSLNAIRQIVDGASQYPGLLWVFTGTPRFFDDRHGVKGLEPLYDRIKYEAFNGVPSLRQPQLELKPFDRERLIKVALKLRSLHPDLAPDVAEQRLPKELVHKLVDEVTEGFKGDVGVVPRQFLRRYVDILDILADDPDADAHTLLGFKPMKLTPEEEAVLAGRDLDAPPEDEGFGGSSVAM